MSKLSAERAAAEEMAARDYADLWQRVGPTDHAAWLERNADIVERWSMTVLRRIKTRAWTIIEGRATRWNDHVIAAGPDHLCGEECRLMILEGDSLEAGS